MLPLNKRTLRGVIVALTLAFGCGDDPLIAGIVVRVEITPANDTLYLGEVSTRLVAQAFNAKGDVIASPLLVWKSDQPFIASVDSLTGAVTGLDRGVAAVTVNVGSVADTTEIFVVNRLSLPLDTLVLALGDTITAPLEIFRPGTLTPSVSFGGGAPGVASIDPGTGLITALGAGTAAFVAETDALNIVAGAVQVRDVQDTIFGYVYAGWAGVAGTVRSSLQARAFNHPTLDGRTLFQISARDPGQVHTIAALLIDSLVGPGTRTIEFQDTTGIGSATDPVCRPNASFVIYLRTLLSTTIFLSQANGSLTITSDRPIGGGRAIGGRMDVELQQTRVGGAAGHLRLRATFAMPLVTLATCPQ